MLGGGGHAKSCTAVIDSFRTYSISLEGTVYIGCIIHDTRLLSDSEWAYLSKKFSGFVLGIGQVYDPSLRIYAAADAVKNGGRFATLISPYATVSPKAKIGEGTVIMPGACVNSGAVVGKYCIINTGAIVEHDAVVNSFTHVSTGAVVNGDCKVGRRCFIGSNAVILNQIDICPDVMIGAGSVVVNRITRPGGIYVGNPAKYSKHNTRNNCRSRLQS